MAIPFKRDPVECNQRILFPTNIFDLLQTNHICYVYDDIFKQLDTSNIEKKYSIKGQRAYHPRLVVGILIYAYSNGIFSSRMIERKCHEELGFMYISHMNCPNFRVLSDFRKDNSDFFKECFKQTVLIAMQLGLVSLGHISLDGSKFKANTSKHKAMSYKYLKEKEKDLMGEIETLTAKANEYDKNEDEKYDEKSGNEIPEELKIKKTRLAKIKDAKIALEKREAKINPGEEIDDNKQISFADKEARIMGKKGNFDYAYNGQISVDSDNQIIAGEHLSLNTNDKNEVKPGLNEIKDTTGRLPDKMSADNGYMSGDNLEELSDTQIDAYIATGKGEKKDSRPLEDSKRDVVKSDFIYDAEKDVFVGPTDCILELKNEDKNGNKKYQASHDDCSNCYLKIRCCKSKKGEPRTISTDDKEPLRKEMNEKMEKKSSRDIYKKRKTIVEPVFGQIKNSGFRGFSVRGYKKAAGEFSLICAVHNLKKIIKAILIGKICLDNLNSVSKCA